MPRSAAFHAYNPVQPLGLGNAMVLLRHSSQLRASPRARPLLPMLCLAIAVVFSPACAARPKPAPETQMRQLPAPEPDSSAISSTTEELRRLMEARNLTELRTTYNGKYGASLLFQTETLTYFVALFHDRNFWRVIKTDAFDEAEQLYGTFVEQTRDLAQVHIDTIRLDAGKRYTERMVSLNSQRLQTLQQEVEQQREQSMQVSAALQQARQQAVSLSSDLRATNNQLDAINQSIRTLQEQQSNPDILMPPPAAPAPAQPAPAPAEQPATSQPLPPSKP